MEANRENKTYFEQQREAMVAEISTSLEHVLNNIDKLNRSLEAVISLGNEFSSVEALWSQFEGVMAKDQKDDVEGMQGDKRPDESHGKQKDKEEGAEPTSES